MFRKVELRSKTSAWYWVFAAIMVMPVSLRSQTQSPIEASQKQALQPPILEVATIRPVKDTHGDSAHDIKRGRSLFVYQATVKYLMMLAYGIDRAQVVDGPNWAADDEYDVQAQAIEGVDIVKNNDWPEELLKEVLADRFKLKFHREQRKLPVYVLSVAKGGSKLKASDPNSSFSGGGGTHLGECSFRKAPLSQFSNWLSFVVLDRKIVDNTGLTDNFDFDLKWSPDETQFTHYSGARPMKDSTGPNLFTAIQEQLGLKLKPMKAPLDVLVIDHVERPSEN
ncbi:MAG: TIGR03435 family protein [Desulfosporosinus sp.]|nr:TIGR03435 family protein [Desulfosporosinus sp.]